MYIYIYIMFFLCIFGVSTDGVRVGNVYVIE